MPITLLGPYAALFSFPGSRRLVVTSLASRLLGATFQIPLFLLAQTATGSYLIAALVSGADAATAAAAAPLRGRLIDRIGTRRGLPPLIAIQAGALAAQPLAAGAGAGWLMVTLAAAAGVSTPPLLTCMRLEWQHRLPAGDIRLPRAYAFESVAQVALFVVGPLVAGIGIASVGSGGTVAVIGGLTLLAGMAFAAQATDVSVATTSRARVRLARLSGLRTLVFATVLADAALGVVDIAVPSFAHQHDVGALAGPLLAAFAAGSVIGGAVYGAGRLIRPPAQRLSALMGAAAVLLAPLALAGSVPLLAVLLVLAGLPCAAQWATASAMLDDLAPSHAQAEAFTWLVMANGAGIALGSALAGFIIERSSVATGFLTGSVCAALAAAIVVARRRTLLPPHGAVERAPS